MNDNKVTLITVKKRITEKRRKLNSLIKEAITKKQRIHITAPVGTGKTFYAVEIIEKYHKKYQILLLEPQIGISNQVNEKLEKKKIEAFVLNSDTISTLNLYEIINNKLWDKTYISTIDSAHILFDERKVNPDNVIVIVDENHTFLQEGRKDFDHTVDAILKAGCPIIGLSATTSNWVNDFVFNMEKHIKIEASSVPKKQVVPYQLKGIPSTIAQVIKHKPYKKVVIFVESKKEQYKISEAIKDVLPSMKILILNRDERDNEDTKPSWDYLMKHDKLPKGTDVAILNKVVQAGININDDDIELVMLVGKMDPLGFLQYLGRCRLYTKDFHYIHLNYGEHTHSWRNPKSLEQFLDNMQKMLNSYANADVSMIQTLMISNEDLFEELPNGKYKLNRCVAARLVYQRLRNLHGQKLIEFIGNVNDDVVFKEYDEYKNINLTTSNSAAQKKLRTRNRNALPKLIEKNYKYLNELVPFIRPDWKHNKALQVIDDSTTDKKVARNNSKFYLPKSRKSGLINTIKTSKKANESSLVRVLLAAKYYLSGGKDSKIIKRIMDESISTLKKHLRAKAFYENSDIAKDAGFLDILDSLKLEKDSALSKKDWISLIKVYLPSLPTAEEIANSIYDNCFIIKRTTVTTNGTSEPAIYLVDVVDNYDDYREGNNLKDLLGS